MDRYSRLLALSSFSKEDLLTLQSKNVLIVGVGGVGQHVSTYLITNGIIHLTIVDFDYVELSNLNRQILLEEKDVSKSKVEVVKNALKAKNSKSNIIAINQKVDKNNISQIISKKYDVVVDALDNWSGKLLLADECKKQDIAMLHIGVDGMRGQYCVFKNRRLRDLVNEEIVGAPKDGVMGPIVGAISSLATTHLIQYLLQRENPDELYFLNYDNQEFGKMKIPE